MMPAKRLTAGFITRYRTVLKWQAVDLARRKGMRWASYAKLFQYLFLKLTHNSGYLTHLLTAHRYYPTKLLTDLVRREGHTISTTVDSLVPNTRLQDFTRVAASRTLILKTPDLRQDSIEKGVLLISFTDTSAYFHNHVNCEQLLRYFYVVLEPSWSGYCDVNILGWTKYQPHPIVVQATEERDYSFLVGLKSNLVPIPIGASDWVDYRLFRPLPDVAKSYDAISVTNYDPVKRHHSLFKALRQAADPSLRIALVFGRNGDAKGEILQLIDHFNIKGNLVLHDTMSQKDLNIILNMSKVNLLLSLKEGSNRSIFEGFFANVPGIVLKNNIGVKKDYVNESTGRLIDERELAKTLLAFRTQWNHYNPRQWALENISPLITTEKLARCLENIAKNSGEPWRRGLVPKVNSPEAQYFSSDDEQAMPDSVEMLSLFSKNRANDVRGDVVLHAALRRICGARRRPG